MSVESSTTQSVDITPTPRILRTLGDIPFAVWQCFAELMDNSLDAFSDAEGKGVVIDSPRIDVHWSSDNVPIQDQEIIIEDNGPGMTLEFLKKAAKAGYTNNDPINNLGLFGMGFNIATARLGDETTFLSATADSSEWIGIKIDFERLIKESTFSTPVIREPKKKEDESGTKIIVRKLKEGTFSEIRRKERSIRTRLETIYTPILSSRKKVTVFMQGKSLSPRSHCVWSSSRFVARKGIRIEAIQDINRDLGETYFDSFRNRYLSDDEASEYDIILSKGGGLPEHIIKRSRRLKGWLGVQRYSDPSDFGIDFIRNGRKILVSDKDLFGYENPDTGNIISEYPVELGSTVGGRIVGELHVDYLIPTYQKNGFDMSGRAWRLTVEAIRGAGPILPKQRKALGYDGENDSPLGKLVNAYRRADAGTKNLAIPKATAKVFTKRFRAGDSEYQSDEKWYKAAQEADRERSDGGKAAPPVYTGETPSDDVSTYLPGPSDPSSDPPKDNNGLGNKIENIPQPPSTSERDELIALSTKEESLSGEYTYDATPGMEITAWRLKEGRIKVDGKRVPCHFFLDGVDLDFFYDPTHTIFAEYPISPKQLLLQGLAEKYKLRDRSVSFQTVFLGLVENHLDEERINQQALQERAQAIVSEVRDRLSGVLGHRFSKVKEVIHSVEAEEEELANRLLDESPNLVEAYQTSSEDAIKTLSFVGDATIKRLIQNFPEEFMDGKVFSLPYSNLNIGSEQMTERLRKNSLERVLSYFTDLILLLQGGRAPSKHELLRHTNTLALLEELVVS